MMTVTGTLSDGTAYVLSVQTDRDGPETIAAVKARMPGAPTLGGIAWGTSGVIEALESAGNELVKLTPTGPTVELDPGRPASVLAWLLAHGTVASTSGAPALAGRVPDGVVC